mmetsp:Transcript_9535/g.14733  ORF Transcript_9535/g.14733 Transcript_9535/m.14733 type:complete len:308 (+) Transcript_9535:54-977(+)
MTTADVKSKKRKRTRKSKSKEFHDSDDEKVDKVDKVDTTSPNDNLESDEKDDYEKGRDEKDEAEEGVNNTLKPKRKRKRKRKKKNVEETDASAFEKDEKLNSIEHTIYVEGIPFDCTEEDVKDFFISNGCPDILEMRMSRWQDTGRLRGFGHVVFDEVSSAKKAISDLNGKNLGKRYLNIQAPKQPRKSYGDAVTPREQPEGCSVCFVKNLPYDATEDDIHEAFQICGRIIEGGVRVARNFSTRQSKGFGYVEFKNPEGALSAVQRSAKSGGLRVLGRPVFVDYDEGRMRGSFKTQDGRLWSKEHKK